MSKKEREIFERGVDMTSSPTWFYLEHYVFPRCESPIERQLSVALQFLDLSWHNSWPLNKDIAPDLNHVPMQGRISLFVQPQIGRFRPDFCVIAWSPSSRQGVVRCAIECDGHDYHERTKEQARRDKSRDRELATMGWPVLRFTGSEIHKDAFACVKQVSDFLDSEIARALDAEIVERGGKPMHSHRNEGGRE